MIDFNDTERLECADTFDREKALYYVLRKPFDFCDVEWNARSITQAIRELRERVLPFVRSKAICNTPGNKGIFTMATIVINGYAKELVRCRNPFPVLQDIIALFPTLRNAGADGEEVIKVLLDFLWSGFPGGSNEACEIMYDTGHYKNGEWNYE